MPVLLHNKMRFNYEVHGDGPPVVICHGLGADLSQSNDLFAGIGGHRLIVWDSRCHGATEPVSPESELNFPVFADDLRALLDHLGIGPAVVGGISMGAAVATRFAINWPQRVTALLLVRPAWQDEPNPPNLRVVQWIGEMIRDLGPVEAEKRFIASEQFKAVSAVSRDSAESLRQQCLKPHARDRSARLRAMPASAPVDSREQIDRLTMPALVIGNDRDPLHPFDLAQWWSAALPSAEFHQVPSKAVDVQAHQAAVRARLSAFLSRLRGASGSVE